MEDVRDLVSCHTFLQKDMLPLSESPVTLLMSRCV